MQIHPNAVLLLCGEGGEDLEKCRQEAISLNIREKVIFPGKVDQPQNYYQAMDVFVLPSLFEGLSLVGVEARASSLPCVFSDTITKESAVVPAVTFVPHEASDGEWADAILNAPHVQRETAFKQVIAAGFDEKVLNEQVKALYSDKNIDKET